MILSLFSLGAAAAVEARLTGLGEVFLTGAQVRVVDVATLSGGSDVERRRVERQVIATLPMSRRVFSISRASLASLVRRSTNLRVTFGDDGIVRLSRREASATTQTGQCWSATQEIAAGSAIRSDMLRSVQCGPRAASGMVRYDASRSALRAVADIPAGASVGRLAFAPGATIAAGDELTLVSQSGPVRISRAVTALQPGREGRRVFVHDADGVVMAVSVSQGEAK